MYKSGDSWVVGNQIRLTSSGDIELEARSGKSVVTKSPTLLGSATADQEIMLGKTVMTDYGVFWTAWLAHLALLKATSPSPPVDTYCDNMIAAINALVTASANWRSVKHKVDA